MIDTGVPLCYRDNDLLPFISTENSVLYFRAHRKFWLPYYWWMVVRV